MRIIIEDYDNGEVGISFQKNISEEDGASFQDVYSRLMAALEASIRELINQAPAADRDSFSDHLYDIIDDGFANLLRKTFPKVDVNEFNLSAAAIVYAQDQIIQKAEAEGKTYQEMLAEYEAIADKYIEEKRLS